MKPARIVVLVIVLVAGAIAALLGRRSDPAPQVAQAEATDVFAARNDIGANFRTTDADDAATAGRRINIVRYLVSATTTSK